MILYFQPKVGVGEILFGDPISRYLEILNLNAQLTSESKEYDVYDLPEKDLTVYVEDGLVESINCQEELVFKGRNVIGMTYDDFLSYYDLEPDGEPDSLDFEDDNIPQLVFEFDELDLQIWVKNDIVVTAVASNFVDEENNVNHLE